MRKIESKELSDARSKRRTRILTFILLGMLILSSAGYAFFSNPDDAGDQQDSPYGVRNLGGVWGLQYGERAHYFLTSPETAKDVLIDMQKSLGDYAGTTVYVAAENKGILNEIASNLQPYTSRLQEACYGNCTANDLPEKDCSSNLIIWVESSQKRVYQNQNCIFIEGDMSAADAFLYRLFGVI